MNINAISNAEKSLIHSMRLTPKVADGIYTLKLEYEIMNNYISCSEFLNKELDNLIKDFKIEILNKLSNDEIFFFNFLPSLKNKSHPLENLINKKEKVLVDIINYSKEFNELFEGHYVINTDHMNKPEVNFFFSFNKYEHPFTLTDEDFLNKYESINYAINKFKILIKTKEITDKVKGF